jgi:predicted nucleic acid-binding protein
VIVVSETSGLSALIHIGQISLLLQLYNAVVIPAAVREELLRHHDSIPPQIEVRHLENATSADQISKRYNIGRGESEAVALAKEINADFLLVDERRGRNAAKHEGLSIIGVVGILGAAKRQGLIPRLAPLLDELIKTGFFISPEIRRLMLNRAGEE